MPKALLLSAYDAASHHYWRSHLVEACPQYEWTQLALPPRYFSWRVRGNSLVWGLSEPLLQQQEFDLLLATSMVDLSALRGFLPQLARAKTVVYFHENQFAYPQSENPQQRVEPQILSIYSALCADKIAFNSEYNRDSFFGGARALFKKLPEKLAPSILEQLYKRSEILPVPLAPKIPLDAKLGLEKSGNAIFSIVWNHRWEWDKDPELLLALIQKLDPSIRCQFHILGQSFRQAPEVFSQIKRLLEQRGWLGIWGYVEQREKYLSLLNSSHLVLSTAKHDFQGLAVQEAVLYGCLPLLPADLAYPEFFSESYLYTPSCVNDLSAKVMQRIKQFNAGILEQAPSLSWLQWDQQVENYRRLFEL